ncbi:hypothetical protein DFH29DRAFT_286408 [Suillus ampliporus]|nr:hypothetical protein DFH29DRAFT_286408 [Suillus ampliporus]
MNNYYANSMRLQTVAYVEVASIAALLFDFCITFDSEVRWTWGRKWGIVRVAFVISRYVTIISSAIAVYYAVESTRGVIPDRAKFFVVYASIHILGTAAAEVLLVARTHVFWGCKKRFLIAISAFSTVMVAAMLTIVNIDARKSRHSTSGSFGGVRSVGIVFGLHAIYELVMISLTMYKRFKFYRLEISPLVATVYRDGVFYMLCITLASLVNCVGFFALPLSYSTLLVGPGVLVRSVLASRILFNLRATNELQEFVVKKPVASRVVFAQPIQTPSRVDHLELWDITVL